MEENINNKNTNEGFEETFEAFRERINKTFEECGLKITSSPEDLTPEKVETWKEKRLKEIGPEPKDQILHAIERAYIYVLLSGESRSAEYKDLADEELDDAIHFAQNQNLEELEQKITSLIKELS